MKNKYFFGFYINNYPGSQDLEGCENDGLDLGKKARKKGFDVKQLWDLGHKNIATKSAVLAGIKEVYALAKEGDSIIFNNSSHGTYDFRSTSKHETDKTDEGFCVISDDQKSIDVIWDDTIWQMANELKLPGVQCVWIADSCFGGGAMRLVSPVAAGKPRFIRFADILKLNPQAAPQSKREVSFAEDKSPWPFLWLAGSQETEPCYDASYGGRPNGAFTYNLLKVLDTTPPGLTYQGWYDALRPFLPSRSYPQHPLIAGSYKNAKIFS